MKKYPLYWALAWFLALSACSGVRVSQDYPADKEYAALKTYAWQFERQEKTGDLRLDNPFRDTRIRKAVDTVLAQKGYQLVSQGRPDFYVTYQQKIYNRIDADGGGGGFVFGMGSYGWHSGIGFGTGNRVSDYDETMMVIDIVDADSEELLWRGTGTRSYVSHQDPEKITQRINETVQRILSQFPPQKKKP